MTVVIVRLMNVIEPGENNPHVRGKDHPKWGRVERRFSWAASSQDGSSTGLGWLVCDDREI